MSKLFTPYIIIPPENWWHFHCQFLKHDNKKYEHYQDSHSKNCVRASLTNNFYFFIHLVTSRMCEDGLSRRAADRELIDFLYIKSLPLYQQHNKLHLHLESGIDGLCH